MTKSYCKMRLFESFSNTVTRNYMFILKVITSMYFQLHPGPTFRGRSFGRSFMSSENETRGRWQISDFPRFIGTWKSCQHSGHTPVLPWQNDHDTSMPRSHFHCPIHKIIKLNITVARQVLEEAEFVNEPLVYFLHLFLKYVVKTGAFWWFIRLKIITVFENY